MQIDPRDAQQDLRRREIPVPINCCKESQASAAVGALVRGDDDVTFCEHDSPLPPVRSNRILLRTSTLTCTSCTLTCTSSHALLEDGGKWPVVEKLPYSRSSEVFGRRRGQDQADDRAS